MHVILRLHFKCPRNRSSCLSLGSVSYLENIGFPYGASVRRTGSKPSIDQVHPTPSSQQSWLYHFGNQCPDVLYSVVCILGGVTLTTRLPYNLYVQFDSIMVKAGRQLPCMTVDAKGSIEIRHCRMGHCEYAIPDLLEPTSLTSKLNY